MFLPLYSSMYLDSMSRTQIKGAMALTYGNKTSRHKPLSNQDKVETATKKCQLSQHDVIWQSKHYDIRLEEVHKHAPKIC